MSEYIFNKSKVLDMGSGAGFPGIPLKIINPSLEITLLEASQKKVFFLQDTFRKLGLSEVYAIRARAEDMSNEVQKEYFDHVISRALGDITSLLHLGLPYIRQGGHIILMRGKRGVQEWEAIKDRLGSEFRSVVIKRFKLPYIGHQRVIIVIEVDKTDLNT